MWPIIQNYYDLFLRGLSITLLLAIVGTLGGFLLSLLFVAGRTQVVDHKRDKLGTKITKRTLSSTVLGYVTLFRGTPMLLQAMIFFFGINMIPGIRIDALPIAIVVVTLNTTAYITEILRGAVNGIDKGQMEAARSLGFSRFKALMLFVYPQAIKNALPAIVSEFIVNLKDTAVLSVIGVMDLFRQSQFVYGLTFRLETFVIAGILYLLMTTIATVAALYLEKHLHKEVKLNA